MTIGCFAVWTRLELATSCVTGRHSNQLNYHTVFLRLRYKSSANFLFCKFLRKKKSTFFIIS